MSPTSRPQTGPLSRLARRLNRRKTGAGEDPLWQLCVGDEVLGDLVYISHDTPWLTCAFHPTARFDFYRPYFDWVQALAEAGARTSGDPADTHLAPAGATGSDASLVQPLLQSQAVKQHGGVRILSAQSGEIWRASIRFYDDYRQALFALPGTAASMP